MAHAGGRPEGDYTAQIEMGWDYLTKYENMGQIIPTVVGYAQFCRGEGFPVSRETIYDRAEFSDIRGQIREIQEMKLNNGGLNGDYNPRFSMFLLAAKHDYVEKTAKQLTGKDDGPLAFVDMTTDAGDD